MVFEIRGIRTASGERLIAKVEASSLEHAIGRLARRGIVPIQTTSPLEPSTAVQPASAQRTGSDSLRQDTADCDSSAAPIAVEGEATDVRTQTRRFLKRPILVAFLGAFGIGIAALAISSMPPSTAEEASSTLESSAPVGTPFYPALLNVVRAGDDKLPPAPGYVRASGDPGDDSVRWLPGSRHSHFPNITSSDKEGFWKADPGYSFTSKDSLQVQWTPGLTDSRNPGIKAGSKPGSWKPLPGYTWTQPDNSQSLVVVWRAGISHPDAPNVVSGSIEGKWHPTSGYNWANDQPGNLAVIRVGPSQQQVESALAKVAIALLADEARDESDDGSLIGAVFSGAFRSVRDEAIRSALSDLLPNESPLAIIAAANIIILGADGELTADNWTSRSVQEAIVQRISAEDPNVAEAYLLAEFIGNVLETYDDDD